MNKFFAETTGFTDWVADQGADWDREYSTLQRKLMANPELGRVIKGCGGLRKIRLGHSKRRQGKRGGARIIYLHVPELDCIYMVDAYGKDEKEDLTPQERRILAQFAEAAKNKVLECKTGRESEGESE